MPSPPPPPPRQPAWRRRVLTANTMNGQPRPTLYHPHEYIAYVNAVV